MFRKCLKYDLKALRKIWLIAAAIMLVISLLGGLGSFLYINGIINMTAMESTTADALTAMQVLTILTMIMGMITLIVAIYAIAIFASGTSIMLFIRYYTHFFTDQGYLTFTLPVSRKTHFWSKTVSGMIYLLASSLVSSFAVLCIVCGCAIPLLANPDISGELGFSDLFGEMGGIGVGGVLYLIIAVLLFLLVIVSIQFVSLMTQYLLITLAATLFRNHKLLSVIVTYFGFGALMAACYFVGYFFIVIYFMLLVMFLVFGMMELVAIPILCWLAIYALLLIAGAALVTVGLTFANLTVNRLERKLNLS